MALGTEYIGLGSKEMERGSNSRSQPAILGGPCAWGKLGPCARGSRGHGTGPCARGAPASDSCVVRGHGVSGARAHGSLGTSSVAAVALRLDSYGLGVVLLLLGDAPKLLGGVPLHT